MSRVCLPASVFERLRHPPAATRESDTYCWDAQAPGLGDMVASALSAVGITPERISAITGKPCGCKKRQQQLNALGRRLGIG